MANIPVLGNSSVIWSPGYCDRWPHSIAAAINHHGINHVIWLLKPVVEWMWGSLSPISGRLLSSRIVWPLALPSGGQLGKKHVYSGRYRILTVDIVPAGLHSTCIRM